MTVAFTNVDARLASVGQEAVRKDLHDALEAQRVLMDTRIADLAAITVLNAASRTAAVAAGSNAPTLAAIDATTAAIATLSTNLTTIRTSLAG